MKVINNLNRSVFPVRYQVKGSFNLGEICPIGSPIEVVPYDSFYLENAMVIRMATPIAPIMDDLDAEISVHFVPLRLIGNKEGDRTNAGYVGGSSFLDFQKIIANGMANPADWMVTDNELYTTPKEVWMPSTAKQEQYTSIGEALGLGLGIGTGSEVREVLGYPLYGYNLIYQERFRNQNVEASKTTLDKGSNIYGLSGKPGLSSGTDGTTGTYNQSLNVAYKHGDKFTNAVPSPTKGAEVKLPLGSNVPVGTIMDNGILVTGSGQDFLIAAGDSGTAKFRDISVTNPNATDSPSKLIADMSAATAATINSFITAFNVQRLLMNDIKGTRYFELIKNHFSIENDDIRLYIPELLNLRRFAINISPVVQQSGAASATSGTDQGNYLGTTGGYSFTANKGSLVHHTFGEFGYIYFLITIRQSRTYGQGVPRLFLRDKRFDFFFPELGRIGYQKIDKFQLDARQTPGSTYAWEPAFQELRDVADNQVFGFMNPAKSNSLDYWTLAENLSAMPTLSISFLKEDRTNLARALTIGATGPDFIMDAMIYGKKATLVPIGTTPKLFN